MRDDWDKRNLGDICDILDYLRRPVTKRDREPGDIPYYGATGLLDHVKNYIFDERLVLVGEDGAKWGPGEESAYVIEGKSWVNNHAHVLRPNRSKVLDNWIIYYLNFSDLTEFVSGLTVPKLNQARLREIPIPLPPLPEQQRIVRILDEAFAAIAVARANAEKNLRNARELFESYLNAVFLRNDLSFEWLTKKFGEAVTLQRGFDLPTHKRVKGDFPLVSSSGIIDTHNNGVIQGPGVVTGRSGSIGNVFYVDENYWPLNTVLYVKDFHGNNPRFIYYLLKQFDLKRFASGTGVPTLNRNFIHNELVNIPPLREQQRVVSVLDQLTNEIKRLELTYQKKITKIDELKQSLLHHAFTGQL